MPEEVVLVVDGILLGLCAGADVDSKGVDQVLRRTTCAPIQGAFGSAISKVWPYLSAGDLVGGEGTCDGKRRAREVFAEYVARRVTPGPARAM